jgi:hypothetical protein
MAGKYFTDKVTKERVWFDKVGDKWVPSTPPDQPFDFDAGQMVANIPGSAKQLGKDMLQTIAHPILTAKTIANVAIGLAAKLAPKKQYQEKYADAVGQMIVERYGSIDKFQRSFQNDPVGVASDIAGIAMGVGGVAKTLGASGGKIAKAGNILQRTSAAADPVNLAAWGANRAVQTIPKVRAATQGMANNLMASATKFPTSKRSNSLRQASVQDANVKTMLREGLLPNEKSLGKLQMRIDDVGAQIDALIDNAPPDAEIKLSDIIDYLDDAAGEVDIPGNPLAGKYSTKFEGVKRGLVESAADKSILSQLQDAIDSAVLASDKRAAMAALDSYLDDVAQNGTLTVKQTQKAKQLLGQVQNFDAKPGASTFENQRALDAVRRGERSGLEAIEPDLKSLNAQQGGLLSLQEDLPRAVRRIENKNVIPFGGLVGGGAGFLMADSIGGGMGTLAGLILGAAQTSGGQARAALLLQRMVNSGQMSPMQAANISKLLPLQAAKGAGRAAQQEELYSDVPSLFGMMPDQLTPGLLNR